MLERGFLDDYLRRCEGELRLDAKTVRAYRFDVLQYLSWCDGNAIADACSRDAIHDYLLRLNGEYAPASVRRKIASMRAFMSFLRDEGHIPTSPFDGMRLRIREPRRLPRTVPLAEMNRLFRHMAGLGDEAPGGGELAVARDRAVMEVLIATGLRVSELCALDLPDVDIDGKVVRVDGKGRKERFVQMECPHTLDAIRKYLRLREGAVAQGDKGALFLNRGGTRLTDHGVRDMLGRRCREAGVTVHVTPHMFRHTFATWLLEGEVDIRYIQRLLGHSSISTTEIYTHVTSAKLREIMRDHSPRGMIDA